MRYASQTWCFLPGALVFLGLAGGCQTARSQPASQDCLLVEEGFGPPGEVSVRAETVVDGLEVPWGIAFLPNGDFLVTERPGRLRRVQEGRLVEAPVAEIPVAAGGEGGLLGIALHPEFSQNRLFFLYYTANKGGRTVNRVERYQLSEDYTRASPEKIILDDIPAARVHDGGRLRLGPDGMLYISTGDARDPALSQERGSLAGKLLRLTPEGEVPPDNPWPQNPAWLMGLRNLQAFDWMGEGHIAVADHGPSGDLGRTGHDEVSVARRGDNLGWPTLFGCQTREGMQAPILSWREAVPPGGAAFYTGMEIPAWQGSLLIGTLGSRHLHRVVFAKEEPGRLLRHEVYFQGDPPEGLGRLREVIMGPDGHLYVTTSNCDGRGACPAEKDKILRIRAR